MARIYLPLLLLLVVVLEGVALDFLPANIGLGDLMIIPHWLLVLLIMIAVFYDREYTYSSVLYAIFFGLLVDIVYTSVLGVYMFSYALVIYIIHGLKKVLHTNFSVSFLLVLLGISLVDIGIYISYFFISVSSNVWGEYMSTRLLPTLLANSVFFIIIYPLIKGKLIKWSQERYEKVNTK